MTNNPSKTLIGNEPSEKKENPTQLKAMIAAYVRHRNNAQNDKERLVELMRRKSALKWNGSKKAQMVRRYIRADESINEASDAIDQLEHRLSQIDSTPVDQT